MLTANEVAFILGISVNTLNNWYMWKRLNEDHELAQYLPTPTQSGKRATRYWSTSDIATLQQFQLMMPRGRSGIMGEVTQKHKRGGYT